MSKVTNLILATSLSEDPPYLIEEFKKFKVNGLPFNLVSVDNETFPGTWYGGTKKLEINLFIGAYNHLNLSEFIYFMKNEINWEVPDSVQLIVKEQDDLKFRIIELFFE